MQRAGWFVVALVAASCLKTNLKYCDALIGCADGKACNLAVHECETTDAGAEVPDLSRLGDMSGCAPVCTGTAPICLESSCVACQTVSDPDGACVSLGSGTPFCVSNGQLRGECVGCRSNGDCPNPAQPICDPMKSQCRPCTSDNDCTSSLVCQLIPTSSSRGRCVDSSQVVFVRANAPGGGDGLSPTSALQKVGDGINKAKATGRSIVRIANATYMENLNINNQTVALVGEAGATLKPASTGNPVVVVSGTADVTLRNLIVTGAASASGVNCTGAGVFSAYQTQFVGNNFFGVNGGLCPLTLDGCFIDSNTNGGGVEMSARFTIVNSIITNNGGAGGVVQMVAASPAAFVNNTVADNTSANATAGVTCASAGSVMLTNTILYNNLTAITGTETNCTTSSSATDDSNDANARVKLSTTNPPGFVATSPKTAGTYHLTTGSICRDAGSLTGAPDHDFDLNPRPDPTTMRVDIGAVEVQ